MNHEKEAKTKVMKGWCAFNFDGTTFRLYKWYRICMFFFLWTLIYF